MTKGCISQITTKEQVRDNFKISNLASFPIRLKHSHDLFCFALVVCAHPYCACNARCNVTPLSRHHGKKINNNGASPGGRGYFLLLYRQECFTGKCTTRKIHTNPHPGRGWRIFHILTSEDIDDFTDINFVSVT